MKMKILPSSLLFLLLAESLWVNCRIILANRNPADLSSSGSHSDRNLALAGNFAQLSLDGEKCRALIMLMNWGNINVQGLQNNIMNAFQPAFDQINQGLVLIDPNFNLALTFGDKACGMFSIPDQLKKLIILKNALYQVVVVNPGTADNIKQYLYEQMAEIWLSSTHTPNGIPFALNPVNLARVRFTHGAVNMFKMSCFGNEGQLIQANEDTCQQQGGTWRPYLHNMFYLYLRIRNFVRGRAALLANQQNQCNVDEFTNDKCGYLQLLTQLNIPPTTMFGAIEQMNPLNFSLWSINNRRIAMLTYIFRKIQEMEINRLNNDCTFTDFPNQGNTQYNCPGFITTNVKECLGAYEANAYYHNCVGNQDSVFSGIEDALGARQATVINYNNQDGFFGNLPNGNGYSIFNSYAAQQNTNHAQGECVWLEKLTNWDRVDQTGIAVNDFRVGITNLCDNMAEDEHQTLCRRFYSDIMNNGGFICTR